MRDPRQPNEDRFLQNKIWEQEKEEIGTLPEDEIYDLKSDEKYDNGR